MRGIIFYIQLVGEKYHHMDIPPDKYENVGKIVGCLVRKLCHIYSTGKVVIIDNGLCVL